MTTTPDVRCPACDDSDLWLVRTISVQESADHLVPPLRDRERNRALQRELHALWGADTLDVLGCHCCGFGFASPFVAGTGDIYNLIGGGDQHYPGDRFEFGETAAILRKRGRINSLLEIGAGDGAFLKQVLQGGLAEAITATEYDDSAVAKLRLLPGVTVVQGDIQTLAREAPAQHDVICMFQVLEHLDRLDSVFACLRHLTVDDGEVFVAVPNSARTELQERLTGFLDMPPVHIGRWTDEALVAIAGRAGFDLVDRRLERQSALTALWELAKYKLEARTRQRDGVVARIERISLRPLRGVVKRTVAVTELTELLPHYGQIPAATRWFRLRRQPP